MFVRVVPRVVTVVVLAAVASVLLLLALPRAADAGSDAVISATASTSDPCAGQTPGQLCAEYFADPDLSGEPVFVQLDSVPFSHDWGTGSPAPGLVPSTHFSARWTGKLAVDAASPDTTYTFVAVVDDGVRIRVDGRLIVDAWKDQAPTTYRADVTLGPGEHDVVMEYYQNEGGAVAKLGWWESRPGTYRAEYYGNRTLAGLPSLVRFEDSIDHSWGSGGPGSGIPADNFSARWTTTLDLAAGTYAFTATADDGVRLWVDGRLLVDRWLDQAPRSYTAAVTLAEGAHAVRMDYYEHAGGALAKLSVRQGCPDGQYLAEYFANGTLSGAPALSRCEPSPLAHRWGSGSPDPKVPADNFSARWTGVFAFDADVYGFTATADDGIRVKVDGQALIDKWRDQAPTTYRASHALAAGSHSVQVEYFEHLGGAVAEVHWAKGCPVGQYRAEYFGNKTLSGNPAFSRCESAPLSHNWGTGGPGNGLGTDGFSARWDGTFTFAAGNYAFWVTGDDGVRLWVDGKLLIDKWLVQAPTDYSAVRAISAGDHEVRLEYFENTGGAVARLSWIRGADVGLDPGHSRVEPGATGAGLVEYQVTLDLAVRVRTILQSKGYSVNLSRTDSNPVSSWALGSYSANLPIEMAARIRAVGPVRAYVPIHLNGSSNSTVRGTETYYNVDNNDLNHSYMLATSLQSSVVSRIRAAGYWTTNRGTKSDLLAGKPYGHYHSLRGPYPSALIESLFLSNPTEAQQLTKSSIRQAIAQGIADGIAAYLKQVQ